MFLDCIAKGGSAIVSVLYLRKGQIFGHRAFPVSGMELPDMEIVNAVIKQYYGLGQSDSQRDSGSRGYGRRGRGHRFVAFRNRRNAK